MISDSGTLRVIATTLAGTATTNHIQASPPPPFSQIESSSNHKNIYSCSLSKGSS